jgi:hypothetical protein
VPHEISALLSARLEVFERWYIVRYNCCVMKRGIRLCFFLCGLLTSCMREDSGPDAVCAWPAEAGHPLNLGDGRHAKHLSNDAAKAEDIAIRYGDGHSRPAGAAGPTIAEYRGVIDACMATLFARIAEQHHVTPQQVSASLGAHRSTSLDALVMVSFAVFYAFLVNRFVRGLWRRFPPAQDRWLGIAATAVISPVASLLAVLIGGIWSWYAETLRIGYAHLVQRSERIPWYHHLTAIFVLGILVFWILSWLRYRGARLGHEPAPALLGLHLRVPNGPGNL